MASWGSDATCNVAHEFGWLDHSFYFPNPSGFGPDKSPLPSRANISLVNVLHRPRSRYPTTNASVQFFGEKILLSITNGTSSFTGAFSFLNGWTYKPGAKVLVPVGYKKPFDSGVRFCYNLVNCITRLPRSLLEPLLRTVCCSPPSASWLDFLALGGPKTSLWCQLLSRTTFNKLSS
jgi:hypothetical protein